MATDSATKQYIHQQIAANLNIRDVTPQSKLSQLVEGFLNEADNFEDYAETTLDNMFLETCSEAFLTKAGAQEGLSRNTLPSFRFEKETGIVNLRKVTHLPTAGTIRKGSSMSLSDVIWLTFRESVDLGAMIEDEDLPVSVDLELSTIGSTSESVSIMQDSGYALPDIEGFLVKFSTDIVLPVTEETLDEFRARVLFSKYVSKHGSESAVKLALASSSYVTDYHIDYSTSPFKVQLFSRNMLTTSDYASYIDTYAKPVVESQLLHRKAAGTSFELSIPSQVRFGIVFKSLKPITNSLPLEAFSFSEYIEKTYRVGTPIKYSVESLKDHLLRNNVDISFLDDFEIIFNRKYMNFTYASDDNSVQVYENEYPFLDSITVE